VAEHLHTGLTRRNVTRLVAVACIGALGFLPAAPAHASTTSDQLAATTKAVDAAAQRWFTAQADAARISAAIADVEHRIAAAQASMEGMRKIATARALVLYKNGDSGISSMFGENALDSARRAHLVNDANAGGDEAIAQLTAAVSDLNAQRKSLEAQRTQEKEMLREVAVQRSALDAQLAGVRTASQQEARFALAAAQNQAARDRAVAKVHAYESAHASDPFAAPTGPPTVAPAPVVFTVPPSNGQVSSHHDDPFLSCTRMRESGGRYDIVSSSGYYGAYQFLPSTWDTTAVHAGRRDLVGVLPSRASEFDQDEMAWTLYQWQGNGPWGGRC
jgi:peptidoglycan hydrolase CwlO-like protein